MVDYCLTYTQTPLTAGWLPHDCLSRRRSSSGMIFRLESGCKLTGLLALVRPVIQVSLVACTGVMVWRYIQLNIVAEYQARCALISNWQLRPSISLVVETRYIMLVSTFEKVEWGHFYYCAVTLHVCSSLIDVYVSSTWLSSYVPNIVFPHLYLQ